MTRWAIVVDLNRCVGCQTCTSSCKHRNATAPGVQWRKVLDFEVGEFPDVSRAFLPVGCMHCDEPPCLDVCPSTATRKRDDGIVTIDYDICIGCAYCAVACPYQARYRVDKPAVAFGGKAMRHEAVREDPARIGVAQKCTLCVDRIDAGLAQGLIPGVDSEATPACINSCISGAMAFGDIEDENSNVSKLLKENRSFRMHEDIGTGPGIHYLYDGEIGDLSTTQAPPMVAEPAGLANVSSRLQSSWDWRAALNFVCGGTGAGLLAASAYGSTLLPTNWFAVFLALAFVGAGLFSVWLEIGRPWRFLNVYRHANRSWMSREAFIALPLFAIGGASLLWQLPALVALAAVFGILFLYAQGRILGAAKGIPAWRQPGIVPLIMSTGLAEGTGLFTAITAVWGTSGGSLRNLALLLFGLVLLRFLAWRQYRSSLGKAGAPVGALDALDHPVFNFSSPIQIGLAGLLILSLWYPSLVVLPGILVAVSGWAFKFRLITKAAFNQGYAINRMPARGAGKSSPGIKPGWKTS